ncbi:DUF4238 domain-containing protein [Plantibacter sp. T3]|uniref:DUF4238 domain-containing protein n=1 Tax=Plantibacter sp. T3 TaxID=2653161 RepID=UPI0012F3B4BC|nr:DUF4238 domain-containing protein [Plantibacter sp. T3]VXC26598.1 conserved hypothetical protein [Plantibacter sp. T3]
MSPRHHTVPQLYLRNFADTSEQVVLVSRDELSLAHRSAINRAIAEVGFYRIETEALAGEEDKIGFDPEDVETALSKLESAMSPTIHKLVEGRFAAVDKNDWYRLIQFTALQTVRGHRSRNDVIALITQSVRTRVLDDLDEEKACASLERQGKPSTAADAAAFVEDLASSRFPRIVPPQAVLVQESLKMAFGDTETDDCGLAQHLVGKKIEVIVPKNATVLTSDEPVCWWSPEDVPVGYATARVVWLPLSPRLIVQFRDPTFDMAAHGLPDLRVGETHDELVAFVNRAVASQAERWIVHHPDDAPIVDMVLPKRARSFETS